MQPKVVLLLMLGLSAACYVSRPQEIRAIITSAGVPVSSESFVISADARSCANPIAKVTTSASGSFEFSQQVKIGTVAVLVQHLALCRIGSEEPIWSTIWGPAPARVELRCDLVLAQPCVVVESTPDAG